MTSPAGTATATETSRTTYSPTPLLDAQSLAERFGVKAVLLKYEGANPTGTQKDRVAQAEVEAASRKEKPFITVATCGNFGCAISLAAQTAGIKPVIFIPTSYHPDPARLEYMRSLGAEIIREGHTYEDAVVASQQYAATRSSVHDANAGGVENAVTQLRAYSKIAFEIVDQLGYAPDVVAVPTSNGTTIAGIQFGFEQLKAEGRITQIPQMVACSSKDMNPIVIALNSGTSQCVDLSPTVLTETFENEPLINWHWLDGDEALQRVRSSNGWGVSLSDFELRRFAGDISKSVPESLSVLPASGAALGALAYPKAGLNLNGKTFVLVLTGKDQ